jgi:hypothetical protein
MVRLLSERAKRAIGIEIIPGGHFLLALPGLFRRWSEQPDIAHEIARLAFSDLAARPVS